MPTPKLVTSHFTLVLLLAGLISLLAPFRVAAASGQQGLQYIATVAWLKKQLDKPNGTLKLIDVRSEQDYANGHIQGAVNFPVELSFQKSRIVSIKRVRTLLSERGIRNKDKLVVYDDGQMREAAHVFWMLETYGHDDVVVLDGGLAAWQAASFSLTQNSAQYPRSHYVPTIRASHLTTRLGALLALNNPYVTIIDSRDISEYNGEKSKATRAGHIPNAQHINPRNVLAQIDGITQLKNINALEKLYKGVKKDKEIITYCNRGKDSAMNYLILRSLGYKTSIYDGGWLEWGNDHQLPITQIRDKHE